MSDDFKPVLRFAAFSDLHYKSPECINIQKFERGLELLYSYADGCEYKNVDAVCITGDFTDNGTLEQMLLMKQSLDKCVRPGTEIIITAASHEHGTPEGELTGMQAGEKRFAQVFKRPLNVHTVINGYHFIAVSCGQSCRFTDAHREYAAAELKKASAENPKKAIFFFQHPHIRRTVYGSVAWGNDGLNTALINYPQIIDFSGHSHAPVNDPRNAHQKYFTSFGTGSMAYFELDEFDKDDTVPPDSKTQAQFLIVEADRDSRVRVLPFDVESESFFDISFNVDTPWDPDSFIYTDERYCNPDRPYFESGADIRVRQDGDGVELCFSQAKSDTDGVNDYRLTLYNEDGNIVYQRAVWSGYYHKNMPERVSYKIGGLMNGSYRVRIFARGFWYNLSRDFLETEFTLQGKNS